MIDLIKNAFKEAQAVKAESQQEIEQWLMSASKAISSAIKNGNKVLIAGNGGSAADAQHFAAELVVRLTSDNNRKALPAISLTTDTSIITAAANDFGYEFIFSRQLEALGKAGDVLIGISTSGSSASILSTFKAAHKLSIFTVGMFGEVGCLDESICDLSLKIKSKSTMRIQEEHTFALHILVQLIEKQLFDNES